jgi:hypothetical protein
MVHIQYDDFGHAATPAEVEGDQETGYHFDIFLIGTAQLSGRADH